METIELKRKFSNIWKAAYNTVKWDIDSMLKREADAEKSKNQVINRNEVIKPHEDPNGNVMVGPKYVVRCPQCKKFVGSVQKATGEVIGGLTMICPHCNLETDKWVVITIKKGFVVTKTDFVVSESQIEKGQYKEIVMSFLNDHKEKKFEVCHDQVVECCSAWTKEGEVLDVEICEN